MSMPLEEITYRAAVQETLGNMNARMKTFENDVRESMSRIELKGDSIDKKLSYTNGKVRKIIIALVLLAGIIIGQTFGNTHDIIALLAHAL